MKRPLYLLVAAMMVLVALIAFSCKKVSTRPDPSVKTGSFENVTDNSALLNGSLSIGGEDLDAATVYFLVSKKSGVPSDGSQKVKATRDERNFSGTASNLSPSTVYYYKAMVDVKGKSYSGKIQQFTTCEKLLAVDLGIIVNGNRIMWASYNLGARDSEDFGDYYAWGETEPKSQNDFRWSTYKWGSGENALTKYVYGKKTLEPEDDAAHVKLGGKWRMATDAEGQALMETMNKSGYKWTWYERVDENGEPVLNKYGNKIYILRIEHTSSGNYINFPAGGYMQNGSWYEASGTDYWKEHWSCSWTSNNIGWDSNPEGNAPFGRYFRARREDEEAEIGAVQRFTGMSIRAVWVE